MADDFTVEDRRAFSLVNLTRADLPSHRRDIVGAREQVDWAFEPLAIRGDRLALGIRRSQRVESTFGTEFLWLVELDDHGLTRRHVLFDIDQLGDAVEQLDEWYAKTLTQSTAGTLEILRRVVRAYSSGDIDLVEGAYADDVVFVDHRPVGFGTLDKAGQIERLRSRHELDPGFEVMTAAIHRISEHGFVSQFRFTNPESLFEWDLAAVFVVTDSGRAQRVEFFGIEELDGALARFDELTAGQPTSGKPTTVAQQMSIELLAALDRRDYEGLASMLAPDFTMESRRQLGTPPMDAAGWIQMVKEINELAEDVRWSYENIATRGEHLNVHETRWTGSSGFLNVRVVVAKTDETGRMVRVVTFDPDQLHDGIELLDEWYTETLDDSSARAFAIIGEFNRAYEGGDFNRVRSMLSDEFRSTDHRLAAFEELDADGLLARMRTMREVIDDVWMLTEAIHRLTDHGMVSSNRVQGSTGCEWELALLEQCDGEGLITRLDFYEVEDLDAALARFGELTTEPAASEMPKTLAERSEVELFAAINRRDYDTLAAMLTPDFTIETRRLLGTPPMEAGGWIEMVKEINELTEGVRWSSEAVATRGDRHLLNKTVWGGDSGYLNERIGVVEYDETGRAARVVTFDPEQLYDAIDQLDEWYCETLANDVGSLLPTTDHNIRCFATGDFDAIRMSDDFVSVDHRPGSFGRLDKAGHLDRMRARHDVAPAFQLIVSTIYRLTDVGIVGRVRITDTDSVGEWDYAMIILGKGDQVTRMEYFEIEDLDAALARFDELTAAG
jgi:ketosteroid isomerase-like protein